MVNVADEYLAELGAHQHAWLSERATAALMEVGALPDDLRDACLLRAAAQPVIWVVIKLSATGLPGTDRDADAGWAAMMAVTKRDVLTLRRSGLEAGLADAHLGLINRLESRIGSWPETEWREAVRGRVQALVEARDRGRERGQRLRSRTPVAARTDPPTRAWMLRHPTDHYFKRARAGITDPVLVAYLDQQISAAAPSYAALATRDWSSEIAQAELVVELEICLPVPPGWKQAVPATVVRVHRGSAQIGAQIGVRLVADPDAPFDGTLISVLSGEHWLVCSPLRYDGTLCPADGTRRLPTS